MSFKNALLVFLALIPILGVFIYLSNLLGLHSLWLPFIAMLYYAGINHMNSSKALETIGGAFTGISMPFLGLLLPMYIPSYGGIIYLVLLATMIILLIMNKLSVVINNMAMIILTVLSIHSLVGNVDQFLEYYYSLLFGTIYFGIIFFALGKLQKKQSTEA